MTDNAPIKVNDLTIGYGDFVLLKEATYQVNKGDVFIIMGGSGCGKSSMLRVLTGLLKPQKGSVFIKGTDITKDADDLQKIREKS